MVVQLQSWRPTSAPVGKFTGSLSCATSSLDTLKGQCGATAGWAVWVGLAPHSLLTPLFSPQLCIYRVCFAELCQGCCEDG